MGPPGQKPVLCTMSYVQMLYTQEGESIRMKCECGSEMEFHEETCVGYFGDVTEGPHYFCSQCPRTIYATKEVDSK